MLKAADLEAADIGLKAVNEDRAAGQSVHSLGAEWD
jgi:hypothetical protein